MDDVNAIELVHITKRFGTVIAVNDLSLSIRPGTFITLLGPSGCGKTTTLRMIAGLEDPDDGELFIAGKPVFSRSHGAYLPTGKRQLGMVFQSYALWRRTLPSVWKRNAYPKTKWRTASRKHYDNYASPVWANVFPRN